MDPSPNFYDANNIHTIDWPNTEWGQKCRDYFVPMILNGSKQYVSNADVPISILKIDDIVLPIVEAVDGRGNSYVCSPMSNYIYYPREEVEKIDSKMLRMSILAALKLLRGYFHQAKIEKVVYVNNWLLSTNFYPDLSINTIQDVIEAVKKRYPNRAIVFRSLNGILDGGRLMEILKESGCRSVLSRQIYFYDSADRPVDKIKQFKIDRNLVKKCGYRLIRDNELMPFGMQKIRKLYDQLYLDKYSKQNPQFSSEYLSNAFKSGLLKFFGFEKGGELDAAMAYFSMGTLNTAPVLGYETALPQNVGLYRMLSYQMAKDVEQKGGIEHRSAGVGKFKKARGAKATMEYAMIFHRHLPLWRRLPWLMLEKLSKYIAEPILRRYEL